MSRLRYNIHFKGKLVLASFFAFGVLTSCVGNPPLEDYNMAHTALQAAQAAGAKKHVPGLLMQAEQSFSAAKALYEEKDFEKAGRLFVKAREIAEKAEVSTRVKKFQLGESF